MNYNKNLHIYKIIKFQLDSRYKAFVLKDSRDIKKKSTSLQIELHNNRTLGKNESEHNFFYIKRYIK